jgi:hypothetical protein
MNNKKIIKIIIELLDRLIELETDSENKKGWKEIKDYLFKK